MRGLAKLAGLVPVVLAASFVGAAQPARADTPATLYVDQSSAACSDSGPGSQAEPFCTIQAAANVVTAGQTVQIESGNNSDYREAVTIRNSGTPTAPITFTAETPPPGSTLPTLEPTSGVPLTLDHVHDVAISHLLLVSVGNFDTADVAGSQDVTFDRLSLGQAATPTSPYSAINIDGTSSRVTVSRSYLSEEDGYGVRAQPGAQQVTVTTDYFRVFGNSLAGVSVSGTSGAAITSNAIQSWCGPTVYVGGGSSATVENNLVGEEPPTSACTTPDAALSVSADSTAAVRADYNAVIVKAPHAEYSWGGTAYQTAADFAAGTGQGTHDFEAPTWPNTGVPAEGSPLIDSADCSAPGELSTDFAGRPRVDDTLVTDTGNGTCHADRGLAERQDSLPADFTTTALKGVAPLAVSVTAPSETTSSWNEPVSYTVGFGDGSGPVAVAAGATVSHTYQAPGLYSPTLGASDSGGSSTAATLQTVAGTQSPPPASLIVQPHIDGPFYPTITPDTSDFTVQPGADDWEVASDTVAFGDGNSGTLRAPGTLQHGYAKPGTYPATLTVTDLLGRTSTATAAITVGDEYNARPPFAGYTGTVAAHTAVKLSLATLDADTAELHTVALRVLASDPAASGWVTVYPDGTTRPEAGTLHVVRGQSASNLVWVTPGASQAVDFYNGSGGKIKLSVFTFGMQVGTYPGGVANGDTYAPDGPARVLDTRSGLGARQGRVPAHGNLSLQAAGSHGIPASAHSVVLDVTASGGKAAGHLTAYDHALSNPGTPDVTWATGQTSTGLVIVPLTDGKVAIHNSSSGSVNVFADAVGYYNSGGTGSVFLPAATRIASATIGPKRSLKVQAGGIAGLPGNGISAVAVNLTASGATAHGSVTGYPDGASLPTARVLSYQAARTTAEAAIIPVGGDGAIRLYNDSAGPVTVRVDLTGAYYQYPSIP